ncbi:strG [Symbiodinium natans]|uniref:StrG protein n=1 Tax=Symbiodinium natans TaxID=878477 RepID=A0A812LCT6_9DINO|nr:strG [Symbiodinium natans]
MAVFTGMEGTEVTFVYSRTFIDEAPASDVIGAQLRSASEPPAMMRLETASEARSEEESLRGYVRSLGTSFMRFPVTGTAMGADEVEALGQRQVAVTLASCGSRGHPHLCRRPCIYFVAGKCETGARCNYCHMSHEGRTAKMDKQQRSKFNAMGCREGLLLLHRLLTVTATENGFLPLAKDFLDLVAQEAQWHPAAEEVFSEAMQRRLERVIARMPFHQLALLAVAKASRHDFGTEMVACVEKLTDELEAMAHVA